MLCSHFLSNYLYIIGLTLIAEAGAMQRTCEVDDTFVQSEELVSSLISSAV